MGTLVFQATLGGQVNLTGPNTASTFTISVPAVTGTLGAFSSLTNNGVAYVNGSGQPTSGSALTFDGTNLGLGVTPSAWGAGTKALEMTGISLYAYAAGNSYLPQNSYFNGTNWIYKTTAASSYYQQAAGAHYWNTAPSGTAGNAITFTQAMTLFASGSLALGTTSDPTSGYFAIGPDSGKTANTLMWLGNTGGRLYIGKESSAGGTIVNGSSAYAAVIATPNAYPLQLGTNNNVQATIDSSGNLGLGVTPSAWGSGTENALQVKYASIYGYSNYETGYSVNAYYNASWKYIASTSASQYKQSNGTHAWYNAPSGTAGNAITFTQRMTLESSGAFLVGTTNSNPNTEGFRLISDGNTNSSRMEIGSSSTTNSNIGYSMYSTGAAAYRFYVGYGGTINATSIVITAISDERLKENVRDIDTGLNSIMALKPRRFDWKEGKGQDKKDAAGFIAQEFETVFPECVSTSKAGEDGIEYKNINHETLIPTLVKAIQEQQAIIESLTTRLTTIEGK
jgi:hypothetical protein